MSSKDRRSETIGGELVAAEDRSVPPAASAEQAVVVDGSAAENNSSPPSRPRSNNSKRPVAKGTRPVISQPVDAIVAFGATETVADSTGANDTYGSNGTNGTHATHGTSPETNAAAPTNGSAAKRRPQKPGGRDAGHAAGLFDPGLISAAPSADRQIGPDVEVQPGHVETARVATAATIPAVTDDDSSTVLAPPAQSPDKPTPAASAPTFDSVDLRTVDGLIDGDAGGQVGGESAQGRRSTALGGGLLRRLKRPGKRAETIVADSPEPAIADWIIDDLPPPLAPPSVQPPNPAPLVPIGTTARGRLALAPAALQPQVRNFPVPTRMIPTTTPWVDSGPSNYVDNDPEVSETIPALKRPVRTTAATGRRRPRIRRVTRVVRHVDPWSVFKVALCFSTVLYGVCLTAGVLLWNVAYTTGTIDNIERFFESFGWESFEFKGGELFHNAWIAGLFAAVGLTGFIVLSATLFNLITDLVGGIRVTVLEEEVVERDPAMRRQLRGRRATVKQVVDPYDPDAPLDLMDAASDPMPEPVRVEPTRGLHRG